MDFLKIHNKINKFSNQSIMIIDKQQLGTVL